MRFRFFLPLSVCLTSGVLVAAVWGQGGKKPAEKPPAAPSASQPGNVIIRGENSSFNDQTGIARFSGNVTVAQGGEDFILYAQDVIYNRAQNRAIATGKLRVETRDCTIRGERIEADFNEKKIVFTGSVALTTRAKGDGISGNRQGFREQVTQKPAKIYSARADWDYEDRQGVMTGNLRMTQGDGSGTCERINYDETQNVAQLVGNVRFRDKRNRVFNTPNLTIYINESRLVAEDSVFSFPAERNASPTPRATKTPILRVPPPPRISDDDLKLFATPLPPLPTPRPRPTRAATPTPAPEPTEAPEAAEPAAPAIEPVAPVAEPKR